MGGPRRKRATRAPERSRTGGPAGRGLGKGPTVLLANPSGELSSAAALADARKKRMDKAAGSAVISMLRYGNEFAGPWFGDAIPLAAAGYRLGISPGVAGAILAHNTRMIVDCQRRIVWETGSREYRVGPEAVVPAGPIAWMLDYGASLGWTPFLSLIHI